jgi:hypothetical protein
MRRRIGEERGGGGARRRRRALGQAGRGGAAVSCSPLGWVVMGKGRSTIEEAYIESFTCMPLKKLPSTCVPLKVEFAPTCHRLKLL